MIDSLATSKQCVLGRIRSNNQELIGYRADILDPFRNSASRGASRAKLTQGAALKHNGTSLL